jgi:hypothetical protein
MATYEDVLTEPTRINLKLEDIVKRGVPPAAPDTDRPAGPWRRKSGEDGSGEIRVSQAATRRGRRPGAVRGQLFRLAVLNGRPVPGFD